LVVAPLLTARTSHFAQSQSLLPDARATLQQAITESRDEHSITPGQRAVTHSNMSAVLSAMRKVRMDDSEDVAATTMSRRRGSEDTLTFP
jgi:hypothetical protein